MKKVNKYECIKFEFQRRKLVDYENLKIIQNGDIQNGDIEHERN